MYASTCHSTFSLDLIQTAATNVSPNSESRITNRIAVILDLGDYLFGVENHKNNPFSNSNYELLVLRDKIKGKQYNN